MNQRELLRVANVLAALRAIVRECRGPDKPFSTDSYLPPHLLDLAVAALDSAETQEHETPLQVIKSVLLDDAERAPSAPAGELELFREALEIGLYSVKAVTALYGAYPPSGLGRAYISADAEVSIIEKALAALESAAGDTAAGYRSHAWRLIDAYLREKGATT